MAQPTLLAERSAELARLLAFKLNENTEPLLARALPVMERIDDRIGEMLLAYYGLRGRKPAHATEIGRRFGISKERTLHLIGDAKEILLETRHTMTCEATLPDDHAAWRTDAFFTTERGLTLGIRKDIIMRMKKVVRHENLCTVGMLCEYTEYQASRIPGVGPEVLTAIKTMLASEGLMLAEDD